MNASALIAAISIPVMMIFCSVMNSGALEADSSQLNSGIVATNSTMPSGSAQDSGHLSAHFFMLAHSSLSLVFMADSVM